MKKNKSLDAIFQAVEALSSDAKKLLIKRIMDELSIALPGEKSASKDCNDLVDGLRGSERPNCPYCKAEGHLGYIVKRGIRKGVQQYQCKACGKYFVASSGTTFSKTRKSAETWETFIELTISGASLKVCAEKCHIAYQTAFTWRHKILNAFKVSQTKTLMAGCVEMDEMLIPLSYKGNHVKGGFYGRVRRPGEPNNLPRPSFQRGSDNKPRSPLERACVFCMVQDGSKRFYGSVPGVGFMQRTMLEKTVLPHVSTENTVVLTDQYTVASRFLDDHHYLHMELAANTSGVPGQHKPEVVGKYHLQHVNVMHQQIRRFLTRYCGVSSKYLNNYISLFVWLKNMGAYRQGKKLRKVSLGCAAAPDSYVSSRTLGSYPAVPSCA